MMRPLLALTTAASLMAAGSAYAGNVSWSIGIGGRGVAAVISGGPTYVPVPFYAPVPYDEPVAVYEPVPIYESRRLYAPLPVAYAPVPLYASAPVGYRPVAVGYDGPRGAYARPHPMAYRHHHRGGWVVPRPPPWHGHRGPY